MVRVSILHNPLVLTFQMWLTRIISWKRSSQDVSLININFQRLGVLGFVQSSLLVRLPKPYSFPLNQGSYVSPGNISNSSGIFFLAFTRRGTVIAIRTTLALGAQHFIINGLHLNGSVSFRRHLFRTGFLSSERPLLAYVHACIKISQIKNIRVITKRPAADSVYLLVHMQRWVCGGWN